MALPQLTFWTRSLAEERHTGIRRIGERELADGTVADRIPVRRVVQTTATRALSGVVNVPAQAFGAAEDFVSAAQPGTAHGLLVDFNSINLTPSLVLNLKNCMERSGTCRFVDGVDGDPSGGGAGAAFEERETGAVAGSGAAVATRVHVLVGADVGFGERFDVDGHLTGRKRLGRQEIVGFQRLLASGTQAQSQSQSQRQERSGRKWNYARLVRTEQTQRRFGQRHQINGRSDNGRRVSWNEISLQNVQKQSFGGTFTDAPHFGKVH